MAGVVRVLARMLSYQVLLGLVILNSVPYVLFFSTQNIVLMVDILQ